jgi:hypothetical protein
MAEKAPAKEMDAHDAMEEDRTKKDEAELSI